MYKINLQPKVRIEGPEGIQIPWAAVIALYLIMGVGIAGYHRHMSIEITHFQSLKDQAEQRLTDYKGVIEQLNQAKNEESFKEGKLKFVQRISSTQKMWLSFFDDFKETMPQDIWIDRMNVKRNGQYGMEGRTFSYGAVGNFMVKLLSMPHIQSVTLVGTSKQNRTGGKDGSRLVDVKKFTLQGNMRLVKETLSLEEPGEETDETQNQGEGLKDARIEREKVPEKAAP